MSGQMTPGLAPGEATVVDAGAAAAVAAGVMAETWEGLEGQRPQVAAQ